MPANLSRSMTLPHATAMVIGIVLGASIFVQPSEVTRLAPGERGFMLVWLAAGLLTMVGALVCAELASAFPDTGGVYIFLKRIFSPIFGFAWGWAMFWTMHSGIVAAIAVMLARYVAYFLPLGEVGVRVVAIAAILLLSAINYVGVKAGSNVQVALTAIKLVAVGGIVVLLFIFGGPAHRAMPSKATVAAVPWSNYGLAIAAGLFAFGGWHQVTYAAGETRDPQRTIPRALVAGSLVVTIVYIATNAAYRYVLGVADLANSTHVAADATEYALGTRAGGWMAIVVIVSALGALNGVILGGPRVYYAMAIDGLVFRRLGAVHPRHQTPYLAIAAQAVWSSALVAANTYRQLFTRVVYTEWIFFALLAAGLFLLRRKPDYRPTFRVPGYPVTPLLFIAVSLAIVINQLRANPLDSALGLGLILLGLPVYFVWSHRGPRKAIADAGHRLP